MSSHMVTLIYWISISMGEISLKSITQSSTQNNSQSDSQLARQSTNQKHTHGPNSPSDFQKQSIGFSNTVQCAR